MFILSKIAERSLPLTCGSKLAFDWCTCTHEGRTNDFEPRIHRRPTPTIYLEPAISPCAAFYDLKKRRCVQTCKFTKLFFVDTTFCILSSRKQRKHGRLVPWQGSHLSRRIRSRKTSCALSDSPSTLYTAHRREGLKIFALNITTGGMLAMPY